jgi:hypothetical protein
MTTGAIYGNFKNREGSSSRSGRVIGRRSLRRAGGDVCGGNAALAQATLAAVTTARRSLSDD